MRRISFLIGCSLSRRRRRFYSNSYNWSRWSTRAHIDALSARQLCSVPLGSSLAIAGLAFPGRTDERPVRDTPADAHRHRGTEHPPPRVIGDGVRDAEEAAQDPEAAHQPNQQTRYRTEELTHC